MTFKDYFERQANEEIDEKIYEQAKDDLNRGPSLTTFMCISFSLAVLFFIILTGSIISKDDDEIIIISISFAIFFTLLGILFIFLKKRNKENQKKEECIKKKYTELFVKNRFEKYNIPKELLLYEFDETFIKCKIEKRYKFKRLIIDYLSEDDSIRIFNRYRLYKPIQLDKITEYSLLDEGRLVCGCKKGDSLSIRNFIYNKFECEGLELKLFYTNDNNSLSTIQCAVLEGVDRDDYEYKVAVEFFSLIFSRIDKELLAVYENSRNVDNNIVESKDDKIAYEKLIQLKKLYDDGIIDQSTYEEKKKKLVEKL